MSNVLTMKEIKDLLQVDHKSNVGKQFTTPMGVTGTVLAELLDGKYAATFTCSTPGCTNTHIRRMSDWHQCGKCVACSKNKPKPVVLQKSAEDKMREDLARLEETRKHVENSQAKIRDLVTKYKDSAKQ